MKWRRRVNSLKGIDANGGWVEDPIVVKDVIKNFFEQKFKEEGGDSPNLDGICFNQVSATLFLLLNSVQMKLRKLYGSVMVTDARGQMDIILLF